MNNILAKEFNVSSVHVNNIITLLDEGNTVPFIARYRKEQHGTMDDQLIRNIADRLNYLRNLEKRKEEVIANITEKDGMTDELNAEILKAETLARVEDLYRPFKDKRKTRATMAVARGLEPLSKIILEQKTNLETIKVLANDFLNEEVATIDDAISGACDIIAEVISDDPKIREKLRNYYTKYGVIETKRAKEEDSVYEMYYEYSEPVSKIQNHRILAINRGEKEGFLKAKLISTDNLAIHIIYNEYVSGTIISDLMKEVCEDSFQRLVFPSIEREIRSTLTDRASEQAISVFGINLVGLLMQAPIKDKVCLAIDPAYRTGCKIAVCDKTGKVLETGVIYPTPPQSKVEEAQKRILEIIKKYGVEIIAVGNGTASKEAEIFTVDTIKASKNEELAYMMVNEAGASVYSASKLGAEEFPDFDVALRSAVSIARRLQDPLAELVKIDPKSIGVGQYQHDMPQARLSEVLTNSVEDCVNKVGVDLNTASAPLLTYIAGLSNAVAKNVVAYREENGVFKNRKELLKVSKLGPKAFLQCAGFLRITDGENSLDNTSVHPESYKSTKSLLDKLGYKKSTDFSDIKEKCDQYGVDNLCKELEIGKPTLVDIITELSKPGRDIREEGEKPVLRKDVFDMKDLKPGMELIGTVRNVIDFGVFVDIAVHQDGLVHISQITNRYIKHPSEVLKVGDVVKVWVISVDVPKKRIALTMKEPK